VKIIKKKRSHVFCQILNRDVFGWFPAKINNLVPASQARFPQFRVIKRFCIEGSNKRSDHGAL